MSTTTTAASSAPESASVRSRPAGSYAAGANQSLDNPLGVGGDRLHEWAFATSRFRGGGVANIQQYLRTGLVEQLHVAIVPILLGAGERLFDNLDTASHGLRCVEFVSSPAVAHVRFARTATADS